MTNLSVSIVKRLGLRGMAALAILGLLLAIYPLRNVIALRHLLLVTGLIISWSGIASFRMPTFRASAIALIVLTGWLVLQAEFFSLYSRDAFANLAGDWLRGGLAALLAAQTYILVAHRVGDRCLAARLLITLALSALVFHSVHVLGEQMWTWHKDGEFPFNFPSRDIWSGVNNAALALLLADLSVYWIRRKRVLVLPLWASIVLTLTCLALLVTLRTTNGSVIALLQVMVVGVTSLLLVRRKGLSLGLLGLAFVIGVSSVAFDPRTHRLAEGVRLSWDLDAHVDGWLHGNRADWPRYSNGEVVSDSIFQRLSWAHAAAREVADHPLGVGYGHRAFGYAINQRYGTNYDIQSSHNGWLDFTLAAGIPGMLLLLLVAALLVRAGWCAFRDQQQPSGFALVLVVVDYLGRCALDGHLSGPRLEWFWLLTGLLVIATAQRSRQ